MTGKFSQSVVAYFGDHEHRTHFRRLMDQCFIESHLIDWLTLEGTGFANMVHGLISMQGWEQFFTTYEPIYWELTIKVMSLFELDWTVISLSQRETINFQMFCEEYVMSFTDLSMRMELIDMEYSLTKFYSQLHINLLVHLSPDQIWTQTLRGHETNICGTSKVSALVKPFLRYIHAILSRTHTWKK